MRGFYYSGYSHIYLNDRLFATGTSDVIKNCKGTDNEVAFKLGLEMPDITVVYYFEESGKNYQATHNWLFQQEVMSQAITQDEKCFAYGIAAHLIQDSVSHMTVVPKKITQYGIQNAIIHPLVEQTYDSVLAKQNPALTDESLHMMDALDGPKGDRYCQMVDYALGENNVHINVKEHAIKLAMALGKFYGEAYTMGGWMFSLYPKIAGTLYIITPYLGVTSLGDTQYYMDKSVELTDGTFKNWGARLQLSPDGFTALSNADSNIGIMPWILLVVILSPAYFAFKKRNVRILLWIPVIGVLVFLGLSAIAI